MAAERPRTPSIACPCWRRRVFGELHDPASWRCCAQTHSCHLSRLIDVVEEHRPADCSRIRRHFLRRWPDVRDCYLIFSFPATLLMPSAPFCWPPDVHRSGLGFPVYRLYLPSADVRSILSSAFVHSYITFIDSTTSGGCSRHPFGFFTYREICRYLKLPMRWVVK